MKPPYLSFRALSVGFALAILLVAVPAAQAQSLTAIVYLRCGESAKDASCIADLTIMTKRLNTGGADVNRSYRLMVVDRFEEAFSVAETPPPGVGQVILVAHGVFSNGEYSGLLTDIEITLPQGEVTPHFAQAHHGDANRKVNADQVGASISDYNTHSCRAGSSVSSAPNPGYGGNWAPGGLLGSGYWEIVEGSYETWDGTNLTIHYYRYSVYVQTYFPPPEIIHYS